MLKTKAPKPVRRLAASRPATAVTAARTGVGKGGALQKMVLGPVVLSVKRVSVADARSQMPRLVRATLHGDVFEIYNAKNEEAPSAVLVGPEMLRQQIVSPRQRRSLRELVDSLPFKRQGALRLRAELPDDVAPSLQLRGATNKAERVRIPRKAPSV